MKIKEYYTDYKTNKKYPIKIWSGTDKTIDDFYNNCIQRHILPVANVLAWHKMLMEYADRPDAIYWVRYFESGSKASGRWNNRRACLTRFADGFSYVFVSNFDAHEILNMVRLGVNPDVNEFADLMKSLQYPLHYDPNTSCEESVIKAYPNIGTPRGGILTSEKWYLAHIYDIKAEFIRTNGSYKAIDISGREGLRIYPRGQMSDWALDKSCGSMIRYLNYSLTVDEKNLVKAHFLRFVDPLNYYVTPSPKYEKNSVGKRIGEYNFLNSYMISKFESIFGLNTMNDFRKKALIKKLPYVATGNEVINVSYGHEIRGVHEPKSVSARNPRSTVSAEPKVKVAGVGQYAKKIFITLLRNNRLTQKQISELKNKNYCSKYIGISFPILVEIDIDSYDPVRYYKEVINGKYLVCSQWYSKNKILIDTWLNFNGLQGFVK